MITKMNNGPVLTLPHRRHLHRPRTDGTAATGAHRDLHCDDRGDSWPTEPPKRITKSTVAQEFESVDDYISTFPPDVQTVLQAVRKTIHAAAPGAKESISYQIPTFTIDGRPVVYLAGWKKHVSVYPVPALDEELERQLALSLRQGHSQVPVGKANPVRVDHGPGPATGRPASVAFVLTL